ncbi:MAG: biopolymer transporter ExbD [bacterium]
MKRVKESAQPIGGVNIAPIINVAFVLVIVMLMTAPILNIPNMPVDLPEAVTTEAKESNITVSLAKDGRVSVDEEILSLDRIPGRLNQKLEKNPKIMVIIRADKDVMYSAVEDLIDLVKSRSKAKRISVATKQRVEKIVKE